MMDTVNKTILEFLQGKEKFVPAGRIEDYVRGSLGSKASNVSRRLREMRQDEHLESTKFQVNGKGPWCVAYRIKKHDFGDPPFTYGEAD